MTVKELITCLQAIENQDAEVILEDSVLGLAVKVGEVRKESDWLDGAVDLCGWTTPNGSADEDEEEDEE
jgi:hypothetical protein